MSTTVLDETQAPTLLYNASSYDVEAFVVLLLFFIRLLCFQTTSSHVHRKLCLKLKYAEHRMSLWHAQIQQSLVNSSKRSRRLPAYHGSL